jgi:Lrp/AsnC family leucine-responsive transcriptional regulator
MYGKIGLSTTSCRNRLKRLETQGYIDGYIALLNQEKLGLPETVIIEITLDRHDDEILERFGQLLTDLPEVIEAYLTTGGCDYLVKVAVESTAGCERSCVRSSIAFPASATAGRRSRFDVSRS